MAIPLKRAKRRAQRARRRAHQHAPQAGVVVCYDEWCDEQQAAYDDTWPPPLERPAP